MLEHPWQVFRIDLKRQFKSKLRQFHQKLSIWFEIPIERLAFSTEIVLQRIVTLR